MLLTNQKGTAIFVAIMMLVLSTGLGFLAFRVSLTELQISSYEKNELAAGYLADSGVEKILFWISAPSESPNPPFFESLGPLHQLRCTGDRTRPDFELPSSLLEDLASGPFSELKEIGKIADIRIYRGEHPKGFCTVEVKSQSGKGAAKMIRVELTRSPIPPLTAAIQGGGNPALPSPVWAHWGKIRYMGDANLGGSIQRIPIKNSTSPPGSAPYTESGANQDPWLEIEVEKRIQNPLPDRGAGSGAGGEGNQPYPDRPNVSENVRTASLDSIDLGELKSYIKKYGNYYVVSPVGHLEEKGVDK